MAWNTSYHPSHFNGGVPHSSTDYTGGTETPEAFYLPPKGRYYNVDDFNFNWNRLSAKMKKLQVEAGYGIVINEGPNNTAISVDPDIVGDKWKSVNLNLS